MGDKIVVGPVNHGLRNDVTAFVIDNDSFPTLINSYQWRGRLKRKRGTSLLTRLQRFFNSTSTAYGIITSFNLVAGAGNILTAFSLQANGNIVPGSVTLTDATTSNVFTDNSLGTLTAVPAGAGTINYATGAITITAGGGGTDLITTVSFFYYADLPVMGLEDITITNTQFPGTIAFDTKYSYNIQTVFPYAAYDVSFYKNPAADPTNLPGYIPKTIETPTTWNGQDYQQFWTTNYQNGFWATNGINVPFSITNIGMQYKAITGVAIIAAGPPAIANLTIVAHGLVVGDFVFINEVANTITPPTGISGINFQTGYVIAIIDANTVQVEFPNATLGGAYTSGGIAQYLTNRADPTKDSLRFYDGDPTNGSATAPALTGVNGWVNFAPPLSNLNYSVAKLPLAKYYLVGARMIVAFKDRLLFLGPVVQTSAANSQVYLQDTIIYSQNGTPYYTASFTGDPGLVNTPFSPILVPIHQTASPTAYWEDQTGFGGFVSAGIEQSIISAGANEDVLIIGFTRLETRLIYTGTDTIPFNFFIINSELGTESTFSSIVLDKGVMSQGSRGFIMTSQVDSSRIDLEIPDEIFQVQRTLNGPERSTAQRDFINEWVFFTYPVNSIPTPYKFPTQTLQFNYRDNSWAIFRETYTTYGLFRKQTGFTWATVGTVYPTWSSWTDPWDAGESTLLQPQVIAGNQQGFVLSKDDGTNEATSLYIQNIVGNTITSPDHCLNANDYIVISGALGTVGAFVNGKIFRVFMTTQNTFMILPSLPTGLTYLGLGVITRMYIPIIQSKQFPTAWNMARKTRLGFQQYLISTTAKSQITLQIFLSQDGTNAYNQPPIVPDANSFNNSLVYSQILYTCPESGNLGLTPANTNLQMISDPVTGSSPQSQIWHRVNTSLIGDTVQVGFTMSDAQMTDPNFTNQFEEIEIHGFILDVSPSSMLC